ncbi:ORC1-type DNA replication protein [Candidatus Methanoprimaticola sp. MG2]|uniref:ORC1-type DNA replication protein n=1 Tax=Candidatus Methanoprimaticola sp. MG2 TaxID=3228838 RepID=UPI0039C72CD3
MAGENKNEANIFTQYIKSRHSLIKNSKILQTTYIPDNLPHRKDKIDAIVEILAPALNGDKPSNILIIGKTGTGKTAVMNFIGKELRKADPQQENVHFIYINCEVNDTAYGILYSISNQIINNIEENKIPFTGWSLDKILATLTEMIDKENKVFIIVLDEIDRSIQKNGDDIFYYLTTINEVLQKSRVSIIGITNNAKFTELLSPKIKSRLGEEKLVFPPYNVEQLKDILYNRADIAFDTGVLDDDVIPYCAALSAQEMGDARRALELMRISAEIAERQGDPKITSAHVKSARSKIEVDAIVEVIKTLTIQSKILLLGIIKNTEKGLPTMTTGDTYAAYKSVCECIGQSPLTQRRITGLIQELDMLGIIHARIKSTGRTGRTKEIELCIPRDLIEMVKSDDLFKDYKPPTQRTLM